MSAANPARDHHYVPQFYLSQWTGPDHLLWETKIEPSGAIGEKRVGTGGTGYRKNLYTVESCAWYTTRPDVIETKFFSRLDEEASLVLKKLLGPAKPSLSDEERTSWARFLHSLPERSKRLLDEHDRVAPLLHTMVLDNVRSKCESDESRARLEKTFSRFNHDVMAYNSVREHMVSQIRKPEVVNLFKGNLWLVINTQEGEPDLITSDAPLIVNMGREAHPIQISSIPLSPTKLLMLFPEEWRSEFDEQFFDTYVRCHNLLILEGGWDYLYSRDRLQDGAMVRLRFALESVVSRRRELTSTT